MHPIDHSCDNQVKKWQWAWFEPNHWNGEGKELIQYVCVCVCDGKFLKAHDEGQDAVWNPKCISVSGSGCVKYNITFS